jgi:WD40 repeat protein
LQPAILVRITHFVEFATTNKLSVIGVTSIYTPEQRIFYNWSTGREERVDSNVIITAGAAPHYGFKVWNTVTRKNIRGFTPLDEHKHPCKIACLSIDQDYIFFATAGTPTVPGPLYVYDLRAATAPRPLEIRHTSAVTCVRMRQCDVLGIPRVYGISGAYDQSCRLWDLTSGTQLCEFKESKDDIWSVDLHPSGKLAASGADDGAIRIYSTLGNGELLCTLSTTVYHACLSLHSLSMLIVHSDSRCCLCMMGRNSQQKRTAKQ